VDQNIPLFGKHRSNEIKEKIRNGNKNKIISEETKIKMRKPRSEDGKANMKGKKHGPLSDEHKNKISLFQKNKKKSKETIQKCVWPKKLDGIIIIKN
jgi:hypothetical protein